jgi:hypothetical protein
LFIIDDLDRCTPEGIVKTFEAVRLILDIPQVVVIIAVDQRIALAALAKHYEALATHHQLNDAKAIARDYLAKMLHLPIVLAEPDDNTVQQYMSHVWQESDEQHSKWREFFDNNFEDLLLEEVENEDTDTTQNKPEINTDEGINNTDDVKALTEQEVFDIMKSLPCEAKDVITKVTEVGLSKQQKAAFVFWLNKLNLNNPRQLKRLHNSYNLLRLVTNVEDFSATGSAQDFGLLVTLLTLEFINNLDNISERTKLLNQLKNAEEISEQRYEKYELNNVFTNIIPRFRERFEFNNRDLNQKEFIDFVSLYVLPAIEVNKQEKIVCKIACCQMK